MKNTTLLPIIILSLTLGVTLACGGSVTAVSQPTTRPPTLPPSPTSPVFSTEPTVSVLPSGDSIRSLVFSGQERTYILHIPTGYDGSQPTSLVLAFHGIGLDAEEMRRISGFNAQADEAGFIVVYPNGSGAKKSWNGGHCCGEAAMKDVDDVGFTRALIEELGGLVNLDSKRVYVTGFSNGAILVYRLACELSELIAAVGPVAAAPAVEDLEACQPGRPMPLIHFHGTADRLNPFDGGTAPGGVKFSSVEQTIQFWVQQNDCPTEAQLEESGKIRIERYSPCSQGVEVVLYTILDGEHAWPGGEAVSPQIGLPTTEISATTLMWEFFTAHPLP